MLATKYASRDSSLYEFPNTTKLLNCPKFQVCCFWAFARQRDIKGSRAQAIILNIVTRIRVFAGGQ